jgi:hypothetical protein
MCLACEQDAIWLAYLESRGLIRPDDPAAVDALFGAFPVQPLPVQREEAGREAQQRETSRNLKAEKNPFSCDDPTAE